MNNTSSSTAHAPRPSHRASLRLLAFALCWVLFTGATVRSCLKPTKPSQLNAVTIDVSTIPVSTDAEVIAQGRRLYLQHCLQCHLPDGSGGVGANLTDDQWILGDSLTSILSVIAAGTTNAMPGWSGMLSPEDIGAVTSYVYSINPHIELPEDRLQP